MALGASAGLKGNGMVFDVDLLEKDMWSPSLTEDIELHMRLLLKGERVTFAPEAIVWGEMPNNLSNSFSQHMRWEQGKIQAARIYIPRLLATAWQELYSGHPRRGFILFDAVMEFLLPPFSILFLTSLLGLSTSLVLIFFVSAASYWDMTVFVPRLAAFNVLLAVFILSVQGVYLFAGLKAVSTPKKVYRNLLFAPVLMVWKAWQMLLVLISRRQNLWTRTKRNRN
jgi:cellulose synthase/poly-beta-1,6-N-acetylglucosamine synthase-like glycosyltransferase